jgi:predicted esterase
MDVLISGKTSFKVEVPYRLFQTGNMQAKPLIIYLHGHSQNIEMFQKEMEFLQHVEAYHLFIQGPYADLGNVKKRGKWGFSWYLYNGKQGSFVKSLEYTAEFIQGIIDNIVSHIKVTRVCMIGYSMGGYQAGYFALSRWKHVNDLIVIGARIKTEIFSQKKLIKASHMNILAIHGKKDEYVSYSGQKKEIDLLAKSGFNAKIFPVETGHRLNKLKKDKILEYVLSLGYKKM